MNQSVVKLALFLNKRRQELGLTLGQLARPGLSKSELSRVLSGERERISMRTMQLLAQAFKIDLVFLLKKAGYLPETMSASLAEEKSQYTITADNLEQKHKLEEYKEFLQSLEEKKKS